MTLPCFVKLLSKQRYDCNTACEPWSGYLLLARAGDSVTRRVLLLIQLPATCAYYSVQSEMHRYTGSPLICSQSGSVPSPIHAYGILTLDLKTTQNCNFKLHQAKLRAARLTLSEQQLRKRSDSWSQASKCPQLHKGVQISVAGFLHTCACQSAAAHTLMSTDTRLTCCQCLELVMSMRSACKEFQS